MNLISVVPVYLACLRPADGRRYIPLTNDYGYRAWSSQRGVHQYRLETLQASRDFQEEHCRLLQSSSARKNAFVVVVEIGVLVAVAVIVAAVALMSDSQTQSSCSRRPPLSRRTSAAFYAALRHLAMAGAEKAVRLAKKNLRDARTVDMKWRRREITYETASARQWRLLQTLWNGSLEETLRSALASKPYSPTPTMAVMAPVQRHADVVGQKAIATEQGLPFVVLVTGVVILSLIHI